MVRGQGAAGYTPPGQGSSEPTSGTLVACDNTQTHPSSRMHLGGQHSST